MPTLHLMVGLPCAGKTTAARRLEVACRALRLTPDEWQIRLFQTRRQMPNHNARHDLVETLLWEIAARVLELGVDVILDFGFWTRVERESFRARARDLGAASEVHFIDAPLEVLLARAAERNVRGGADTFHIHDVQIRGWATSFERPSADELLRRDA